MAPGPPARAPGPGARRREVTTCAPLRREEERRNAAGAGLNPSEVPALRQALRREPHVEQKACSRRRLGPRSAVCYNDAEWLVQQPPLCRAISLPSALEELRVLRWQFIRRCKVDRCPLAVSVDKQ